MQKDFEELDEAELAALSSEQLDRYVDLACAAEGIAVLAEHPGERPKVNTAADVTVYTLPVLMFTDQAEALELLELSRKYTSRVGLDYLPGPGYKKCVGPIEDHGGLGVEQHFSRQAADTRRAQIAGEERAVRTYDSDLAHYQTVRRQREVIFTTMEEKVAAARKLAGRRQQLYGYFERYLALAEGRRAVAANFLRAAYGDAEELCPDLFTPDVPPLIGSPRRYHPDTPPDDLTL